MNNQVYTRGQISRVDLHTTSFSLSNVLPIFHLFIETFIPRNSISLIEFFQDFYFHRLSDSEENFLQLKHLFNLHLSQNNQEHRCLLTVMP